MAAGLASGQGELGGVEMALGTDEEEEGCPDRLMVARGLGLRSGGGDGFTGKRSEQCPGRSGTGDGA